jgi:WD40 repeat protein
MEQFSLSKKLKVASPNSSEDEAEEDHIRSGARSSDSIAELDIMSLLDQGRLSQIKKDFKLFDNHAIPKREFISIMMHHLPDVGDKLRMVGGLCELFEQIDVNHDQVLEWDEFSNYIIEQGMMNNDRTLIDAFKNYEPITDWRDEAKHENDIEYMQYLPRLKHLLVMERKSKSFKVYNMRTGKFMKEVKGHRGPVISAAHAPELKYVATSGNDLTINLWDDTTYTLKQRISCPAISLTMAWSPENQTLYSGGIDAIIYSWDLKEGMEKTSIKMWNPFSEDVEEYGHSSPVTALMPIHRMGLLVSADLAGKIFLWDIPQNTVSRKLAGQDKGIFSLDWHPSYNCLFSAGLDREAYVWNPYVEEKIYTLSGHIQSLVGVKVIQPYQIVTADYTGIFKIWDIRTFACMQTFNAPTKKLNCFEVTYPDKRIIAGSKWIHQFKYDEPRDSHLADENHTICTYYNSLFFCFISVHPKAVKIWSARNGQLTNAYRQLSKGDLTSAALDSWQRKLYIGDSLGRVLSINVKNGAKIKKFTTHADEVTCIAYWASMRFVVSSSWDKTVRVHDDSKSEQRGSLRYDKIRHKDRVNNAVMYEKKGLLATCSDDGSFIMTNLNTYRQEANITEHESEVKCVVFLSEICIVTTDIAGYIYIWIIKGHRTQKTPLLKFPNKTITDSGKEELCPIRSITYNESNFTLYTGDDAGFLIAYSTSTLLRKVKNVYQTGFMMNIPEEEKKEDLSSVYITAINATAGFSDDTSNIIVNEDVELLRRLKVHKDAITHIHVVNSPEMIITSSFDCNVHIWDFEGNQLGSLLLGNDPRWRIRPETASKAKKDRHDAVEMLESVSRLSYSILLERQGGRKLDDSDEDDLEELGMINQFEKEENKKSTKRAGMVTSESDYLFKRFSSTQPLKESIQITKTTSESKLPSLKRPNLSSTSKTNLQRAALSLLSHK